MGSGTFPVPADPPPSATPSHRDRPRPDCPERPTHAPTPEPEPPVVPDSSSGRSNPTTRRVPRSHPVKGKLASGIYHEPGGLNYDADPRRPLLRRRRRPRNPTACAPRSAEHAQPSSIALASTMPALGRRCVDDVGRAPASRSRSPSARPSPLGLRPTSMSSMLTPGVAEDRADHADHPGHVVVAHDEHVARRRHVDDVVVDARRCAARPACRTACPRRASAGRRDAAQRRRGSRSRAPTTIFVSRTIEAALLGELRRVHERHRLVDDRRRARPSAPTA